MRCDVVRWVAFEDLGVWEPELRAQGIEVRYLDAGVDDVSQAAGADIVIVLGAPISAMDEQRYPYVAQVVDLISTRVDADAPTIGICLGAQLVARAWGGSVHQGVPEVGWAPLAPPWILTKASGRSAWEALVGQPVLHWHSDVTQVPPTVTCVGATAGSEHQICERGAVVAMQCHPEADPEAIEQWLIGHASDLATWGIDPHEIRAQAARHGDAAVIASLVALRGWLEARGLSRRAREAS